MSFSNNFWGQGERGSEVVINKLHQGAQTCEELLSFYRERAALEEEYARRLNAISKKTCGTFETGNLREAFEVLRNETEQMARSHMNQSRKLHTESISKLDSFLSNFIARRKPVEHSVEKIRKTKQTLETQVKKLKERYQNEATKLNTYLAQESLLLGKELDKNREKIYRQQQIVTEVRGEYQLGVKKLQEIHNTWINEWSISSRKLEQMEIERMEFLVSNLWEYSNTVSASCVNDDASCENVRKGLEECDPKGEIDIFVKKFSTGTEIYSVPGFVDFLKGETDEAVSIIQDNKPTRHSSHGTVLSQGHQMARVHTGNSQQTQQSTQPRKAPMVEVAQLHSLDTHVRQQRNLQRRPPPSDDGQTSISNPSTNSTSLHREESAYSNPTSISSFAESVGSDARVSKTWNSPMRRRSRNSEVGDGWMRRGNSNNSNRRSFVLDQSSSSSKPSRPELVIPPNEDPLRATLEDLKHGGNGDMNKLKEAISKSGSMKSQSKDPFASSTATTRSRPKSMLADFETYERQQREHEEMEKQKKRSSFHAGLRSQSKSSVNLQAKVAANGLPSVTREGRRVIRHVKALFDFAATIEGELTFKEGDILLVVHMQEDGWWECERLEDGSVGLAPYNYLERV